MSKTQFLGAVGSGIDSGAPATTSRGWGRFTIWTPVDAAPVTGKPIAVLPPDAVLSNINVWKAGTFAGDADFRFGTTATGSDNLGSVTVSANSIYRAYVNSATAQTTLPYGRARNSAGTTPIYFSTGAISGTASQLVSAAWIEVVYTRIPLDERPDIVSAMKLGSTAFQGPVRSGNLDVGIASRNVYGNMQTVQIVSAASSPVSAQVIGMVPYGATLDKINFYCATAPAGEATVRFGTGNTGNSDNLGVVTVSGARVYSVALTTAVRATLPQGINAGSGQPVYMTVLAASGVITALRGAAEMVFTRRGQADGYPGTGQKETNLLGGIGAGRDTGQWGDKRPEIGWARLSRITTNLTSTNGVVSGALVGFLPIGAALVEINYIAATAAAGEATVRATNSPTAFTSNLYGTVSVSAAGVYSVIQSTAATLFDGTGVNRAKINATAQPVYINVAAASGSIAALSANAAVEIVYARLDPSVYGA